MSKLIEIIRKLGEQSQQPLGFGALAGRSEEAPTLALIGTATAADVGAELEAIKGDVVDAVILEADGAVSIGDQDGMDGVVWGVGPGALSNEDVVGLVSAGCDFFVIDPDTAPAAIVSQPDVDTLVTLKEPADRETAAALRGLGVNGSLSRPPADLSEIGYRDLVAIRRMGASVGGATLVECPRDVSTADLTALRDAGVDAVVVPLSEPERVSDIAGKIRELPPRRKSSGPGETRFQALAPTGSD
ncbi:MAG: hypothetical protein F4Y49_09890 [Dehalococcoidia bacterium]|nr:hypothetical protein [Dehalococcoidia bacterium]